MTYPHEVPNTSTDPPVTREAERLNLGKNSTSRTDFQTRWVSLYVAARAVELQLTSIFFPLGSTNDREAVGRLD
ncbi:hypothetical protein R1flu_015807 [Riccia fluitans]|uniref:Uncharacterized protein n=1 Tax=Riccia fluitans TaxID=41844 RepID=A0ABD1YK19_9MARC